MSSSDLFSQDIAPILDSSKSLDDYINQVSFVDLPSLVYSKNNIKAAQTGGGFSFLHLLSPIIVHTTIFLSGDTRRYLDLTISDTLFVITPSLNEIYIIMSNSKAKEEIFWSNFSLAGVQDFLEGYQNFMNKDD